LIVPSMKDALPPVTLAKMLAIGPLLPVPVKVADCELVRLKSLKL
jgi:hypothetical protein